MWVVEARSLDRLAAVMVTMMMMLAAIPYFLQVGPLVVGFGVLMSMRMSMVVSMWVSMLVLPYFLQAVSDVGGDGWR